MADHIQPISRALNILNALSRAGRALSLAELTDMCQLPKSTTHRLINSLVLDGYVEVLPRGYYAIGHDFLCLAARSLRSRILWHIGLIPRQLRDTTGHSSYVGMLQGDEIVYLHKVASSASPIDGVGHACPANCSAIGKAILATMPWSQVYDIFSEHGLKSRTSHSIVKFDELEEDLCETRRRGYAVSNEENTLGVISIAAPIFDSTLNCFCAVSIDKVKNGEEADMHQYAPHLLQKAREISERMGYLSTNEASTNPYFITGQS